MTIYEIREDRGNQLVIDRLPGWSLTILDELIHECHVNPLPNDEASSRLMAALYREQALRHNNLRTEGE
jgi:hypothetical protein